METQLHEQEEAVGIITQTEAQPSGISFGVLAIPG